jgi:hypothetical protein
VSASPKINWSWPAISLITLLGLGAINIFLPLSVVPKFAQIFQDALPGKPLPGITLFMIEARIPLALIALAWPIAGIIAVWQRHRAAPWIVNLGLLFLFTLIPITVIALYMPLTDGIVVGMSEAPLTSSASSH